MHELIYHVWITRCVTCGWDDFAPSGEGGLNERKSARPFRTRSIPNSLVCFDPFRILLPQLGLGFAPVSVDFVCHWHFYTMCHLCHVETPCSSTWSVLYVYVSALDLAITKPNRSWTRVFIHTSTSRANSMPHFQTWYIQLSVPCLLDGPTLEHIRTWLGSQLRYGLMLDQQALLSPIDSIWTLKTRAEIYPN